MKKFTEALANGLITPFDQSAGTDVVGGLKDIDTAITEFQRKSQQLKLLIPKLKTDTAGIYTEVNKVKEVISNRTTA